MNATQNNKLDILLYWLQPLPSNLFPCNITKQLRYQFKYYLLSPSLSVSVLPENGETEPSERYISINLLSAGLITTDTDL